MEDWVRQLAGRFIAVDGPDGGGKSTQIRMLCEYLAAQGASVVRAVDPGGTAVGDKIRAVLLDHGSGAVGAMCETLLFMASRAQLVEEVVGPAVRAGKTVVCDRFVSATVAYQGAAGMDPGTIAALAQTAVGGMWPDLTIVLDVPVETTRSRLGGRADRIEAKGDAYHQRVRAGFLAQARECPGRFEVVDATEPVEAVQEKIREILRKRKW